MVFRIFYLFVDFRFRWKFSTYDKTVFNFSSITRYILCSDFHERFLGNILYIESRFCHLSFVWSCSFEPVLFFRNSWWDKVALLQPGMLQNYSPAYPLYAPVPFQVPSPGAIMFSKFHYSEVTSMKPRLP